MKLRKSTNINDLMELAKSANIICIIGYPSAGKTTLANKIQNKKIIHTDDFLNKFSHEDRPQAILKEVTSNCVIEGNEVTRLISRGLQPDLLVLVTGSERNDNKVNGLRGRLDKFLKDYKDVVYEINPRKFDHTVEKITLEDIKPIKAKNLILSTSESIKTPEPLSKDLKNLAANGNKAAKILARRKATEIKLSVIPNVLDTNFKVQYDFITHPAKFKALFATRRFGKSYTAGEYLIDEALKYPGCSVLYIALTRDSAKGIMWKDILKVLNRKYDLKAKFNETLLTVTLSNGSVIYLMGADSSEDDKNKILGRKFRLAIIDEAASFTINLRELVYGILKPAMADLAGTICLIGTPGNLTKHLFYDITMGLEPGWHVVKANTRDNPYMSEKWANEILELTTNQPYIIETPMFKQMYLGEWAIDDTKLVYKFNSNRNLFGELPKNLNPNEWIYLLGIDLGWEDDNSFVLGCYHPNDPNLYVVETFKKNHMDFNQVDDKVIEFTKRYPIAKIVIDGANKQGVESMRARSQMPYTIADKADKVTYIELLNSDLIVGKIKIGSNSQDLLDELQTLIWVTKGDEIVTPKREHPSISNHCADAFLYMWRNGYHYQHAPVEKKIPIGSPEWYQEQSENIWEKEADRLQMEESSNNSAWPTEVPFGPDIKSNWNQSNVPISEPAQTQKQVKPNGNYLKPWSNTPQPSQHWSAKRPKLPS